MKNTNQLPYLVVSDEAGNIFELPPYRMVGMSLNTPILPNPVELIPLPYGSDLFQLPDRIAIGWNPKTETFEEITHYQGNPVFPVGAFVAPAHVQILRSAFHRPRNASRLSLYNYTAVGWKDGQFYVSALRIDEDIRQDLAHFNLNFIEKEALRLLKRFPENRLVHHLIENCVFRYGCPAARNFVLHRWECPLPTSPGCNAACVGCISEQPEETTVTAPQERIEFIPTVEEIVEIAVHHLETAPRAVVSFGQGCEGEPLLVGNVIEQAIQKIRQQTDKGTINLNTNASRPEVISRLCQAGLDSVRVSLNSAQKYFYEKYYRPRHYRFEDVVESMKIIRQSGKWLSLNYFIFPGFTDHPSEIEALDELIESVQPDMIQTRNLNIDPDWYMEEMQLTTLKGGALGIGQWIARMREKHPHIRLGYFNPPVHELNREVNLP